MYAIGSNLAYGLLKELIQVALIFGYSAILAMKLKSSILHSSAMKLFKSFVILLIFSTNPDTVKMSLSVCNAVEQFRDVINTLIENVDKHVNEVRTQLVLSVLLTEGKPQFFF